MTQQDPRDVPEIGDEVEVIRYTTVWNYGRATYLNGGDRGTVLRVDGLSADVDFVGHGVRTVRVDDLVLAS